MKRLWPFLVPGILLALVGSVWTLQGLGVLGGSAMSGSTLWAVIGPIVLLVGLVLIGIGVARRRRGSGV
ncbi:cytochrome c-type biogenesis protein CcmH [Microbacterium sp. 2FI]|uniref:cytochrome c-type biogenesis protein CcmH n=1 Tax=Microbacterium sp. 2FI TaxID=2502193 RepID=UPI0010F61479|nr:cytochrome c-type biogenesis protein CcmH [Microbacterium sp. 2FI]